MNNAGNDKDNTGPWSYWINFSTPGMTDALVRLGGSVTKNINNDTYTMNGTATQATIHVETAQTTFKAKIVKSDGTTPVSGVTVTPGNVEGLTYQPTSGTTDASGEVTYTVTYVKTPKTYQIPFNLSSAYYEPVSASSVTLDVTDAGATATPDPIVFKERDTQTGKLPATDELQKGTTKTLTNVDLAAGTADIEIIVPGLSGSTRTNQNVVLVIDTSGSMDDPLTSGNRSSRLSILKDAITKQGGFIDELFQNNPNAKLGIVEFSNTASIVNSGASGNFYTASSATAAKSAVNGLRAGGATNYIDALDKAGTLFTAAGNTEPATMIFLSDGSPSNYSAQSSAYGWYNSTTYGQIPDTRTYNGTRSAIDSFFKDHPDVTPYAISYGTTNANLSGSKFGMTAYGFGNGSGGTISNANIEGYYNFLEGIASKGADKAATYKTTSAIPSDYLPQNVFAATDQQNLTDILSYLSVSHLGNITLTDSLTPEVTIPDTSKIKVYDTLNYSLNPASVNWSETSSDKYTVTGATSASTGTIAFNETKGYGQAYKVVIPVKLTDAAYEKAKNGQPFDTNTVATAQGSILGQTYTANPASPSLALPVTDLTIKKVSADGTTVLSGASFKLQKESVDTPGTYLDWGSGTTGTDGKLTLTGLPAGNYRLQETAAPTDHELNTNVYSFTVGYTSTGSSPAVAVDASSITKQSGNYDDSSLTISYDDTTGELTFMNRPEVINITIEKHVAGAFGDKTKAFTFTIAQQGETDQTVSLRDGESQTLRVKYGKSVTVSESASDSQGYTKTWSVTPGASTTTVGGGSVTISDSDMTKVQTVSCTNTADAKPVTGYRNDIFPFIGGLLITGLCAAGVYLISRRRKRSV